MFFYDSNVFVASAGKIDYGNRLGSEFAFLRNQVGKSVRTFKSRDDTLTFCKYIERIEHRLIFNCDIFSTLAVFELTMLRSDAWISRPAEMDSVSAI